MPMKNTEHEPRQFHPIDSAFFLAFEDVKEASLSWAIFWFRDKQKAMDLLDEALTATVNGTRKWPVGITLKRHLKWAMRSINWNHAHTLGELRLNRSAEDEDPEPDPSLDCAHVLHCLSPEDLYNDAEGSLLAECMADEIFEMTTPGSIEQGVLIEARKENFRTVDVAQALGVTPRQVTRAKESLRLTKVRPVLEKYGLVDPKQNKKTGEAS